MRFNHLLSTILAWIRDLILWGWLMHICISKLTVIGSDNGLSPGRHQAIIWTNAGILLMLIRTLGTNFSEMLREIHTFSLKKLHLKISSAILWTFCLCLNVLRLKMSYYFANKGPGFCMQCLSFLSAFNPSRRSHMWILKVRQDPLRRFWIMSWHQYNI